MPVVVVNSDILNSIRRVGAYTIDERRQKINKFRSKKRFFGIKDTGKKYEYRQKLAEKRVRVNGRFV